MSEQTIQDENNVSTEQNPMVNRIALETKRRNPNTVRFHSEFRNLKRGKNFRSMNLCLIIAHVVIQFKV